MSLSRSLLVVTVLVFAFAALRCESRGLTKLHGLLSAEQTPAAPSPPPSPCAQQCTNKWQRCTPTCAPDGFHVDQNCWQGCVNAFQSCTMKCLPANSPVRTQAACQKTCDKNNSACLNGDPRYPCKDPDPNGSYWCQNQCAQMTKNCNAACLPPPAPVAPPQPIPQSDPRYQKCYPNCYNKATQNCGFTCNGTPASMPACWSSCTGGAQISCIKSCQDPRSNPFP